MTFDEYKQAVSDITNVPIERIEEGAAFRDHLRVDSLQLVNLITTLSAKYNIELEVFTQQEDFATVGSLYHAMKRGVV